MNVSPIVESHIGIKIDIMAKTAEIYQFHAENSDSFGFFPTVIPQKRCLKNEPKNLAKRKIVLRSNRKLQSLQMKNRNRSKLVECVLCVRIAINFLLIYLIA